MAKKNSYIGSSFESWLNEEGIREDVTAAAIKGLYALTDAERAAIAEARRGEFASDRDIAAFWKRHGIE